VAKQNIIEKIAQSYALDLKPGQEIHSGDTVFIRPAHVMTHDNTGAVMSKFQAIGAGRMANPRQPVFTLDHNLQNKSDENLAKYARIEQFAAEMGADFYPAGRGIGHQIMCEEGYVWPGTMVVASDSHSNMYGGLGCLGTPVVRTDAAAIWATGQTWWQVPPVARVELTGKLLLGVTGKDVIITLCGLFNNDEVLNHAIEFTGDGVTGLSVDERLTIANMTTEWGALAGVFPVDTVILEWLWEQSEFVSERGLPGVPSDEDGSGSHPRLNKERLHKLEENSITEDDDAFYAVDISLDLATVRPYCAGPDNLKVMTDVAVMAKEEIAINKAYLISCVNSRVSDLSAAADVVRGKKVAPDVEFYAAPASSEVLAESERRGDWKTLLDAGAIPLPPGCGPCIGLGMGLLEDGEVGISATNRNFKGRMGSPDAKVYLASPAVVAASAVTGKISSPAEYNSVNADGNYKANEVSKSELPDIEITPGFPEKMTGELIFCHQDNLNTDGIYPGKYTYIDDFPPEEMAKVVMENYDPSFGELVQKGDILVGGFNFGTGSSREQAATALKYRGIQMVIAGSFSQTYARNALNNGFIILECPELIEALKRTIDRKKLSVRTEIQATIDFKQSLVKTEKGEFRFLPVGVTAQKILLADGLESWVTKRIKI